MSIRVIVLALLGRISSLLIQESVSFLGVDDEFERIEAQLKVHADDAEFGFAYHGREIIHDLEDVIDSLITQSVLEEGSSYPTENEIRDRLDKISHRIVSVYSVPRLHAGSWWSSFKLYDLNMGNTIVSPVISKLEVLVAMDQSCSALRRKARWLRDEFRMLHAFIRELETKEMNENGMAWMEEVCDVSRLVEDSIKLFESKNEQHSNGQRCRVEKLALSCLNLELKHKLVKELDQILAKVQDILKRRFCVICQSPPSSPARIGSSPSSCFAEKLDVSSFNDDIDEIMSMLLKDDPNCLSISIVGMTGLGKTSLSKLIYDNQAILNHFPYRAWVSLDHQYCPRAVDYFVQQITRIHVSWDPRECDWPTHLCKLRQILDDFLMNRDHSSFLTA